MEPSLSHFQLQRVRYITERAFYNRNWFTTFPLYVYWVANNNHVPTTNLFFFFLIAVFAQGALAKVYYRKYGEVTKRYDSFAPPAYASLYGYILIAIIVLGIISVFFIKNSFLWVGLIIQIILFAGIFRPWLKSPTREVWFFYPVIAFSLIPIMLGIILWIPGANLSSGTWLPFLLNPLLAALCEIVVFFKTLGQLRPYHNGHFGLGRDQAIPLPILQTILMALAACKDTDTIYLGRLTGLDSISLIEILNRLVEMNLVQIEPQNLGNFQRVVVSLTETGREAARMVDTSLAIYPVQSAS